MSQAPQDAAYAGTVTRPVIALCAVAWVASYVVPLYFLPITMFASMWLAVLVWGLAASGGVAGAQPVAPRARRAMAVVPAVLALLALLAVRHHPTEAAVLAVAAGVVTLALAGGERPWLAALLAALAAAAAFNALLAWVQFLDPGIDSSWVAPLATPTRMTGNLRQPNQLAALCLMGLVCTAVLAGTGRLPRGAVAVALAVLLGTAMAFSRSRTGWLGLALLAAWALFDRGLPAVSRRTLAAGVLGLLAGYGAIALKAQLGGADFFFHSPAGHGADLSAQRFGIWANALSLIGQHPLTGVGWGDFGWAWALSPFPGRPVAFFDNAHNLPLQLLAELGVPLGLAVMAAFVWALWRARGAWQPGGESAAVESRGLWVMLAVTGAHSLLEYPLWYTYFLLPMAFFVGVLIRRGEAAHAGAAASQATEATLGAAVPAAKALQVFGVLVVAGSLYAAWDYMRVLQAFKPFGPGLRQSLEERVARGRQSVLFGHWVEYGLLTNIDSFKGYEDAFARPLRSHVNSHLLMQYAKALHERGEDDKAAYVADRLREFHHPISAEFLAECDQAPAGAPPPFQCARPQQAWRHTDFAR